MPVEFGVFEIQDQADSETGSLQLVHDLGFLVVADFFQYLGFEDHFIGTIKSGRYSPTFTDLYV